MWVQFTSTIYQPWINYVSWTLPLPRLGGPDDSLLELAPPPLRKRDRDKKQRQNNAKVITAVERERVRGQEMLTIEF